MASLQFAYKGVIPFMNIFDKPEVNKSAEGRVGMEWIYMPITLVALADHTTWKVNEAGDLSVAVKLKQGVCVKIAEIKVDPASGMITSMTAERYNGDTKRWELFKGNSSKYKIDGNLHILDEVQAGWYDQEKKEHKVFFRISSNKLVQAL